MLSPRRAPNLGKIRRRACLRLIPFPGTGDVLLAPTMISHPLAYVKEIPRHLGASVKIVELNQEVFKGKEIAYFVKIYPSEASPSYAIAMVG